ncbi:MAG: hypothetical protein QM780_01070 [Hyphomicrobium sp.]|uniref:hypothetical protein n=1 Tax=Hyphomicrobium sp. TaxID=82 RepID=UPI0039E48DC6
MIDSPIRKACLASVFAVAFAGGMVSALAVGEARAEAVLLVGTWSGNGNINFSSGSKETARCRAYFSKTGERSYAMSASCATSSAKVEQTAELTKVGANTYVGRFFNEQYNTGGSIKITVSGRTGSVNLAGEAGTAFFRLRRN